MQTLSGFFLFSLVSLWRSATSPSGVLLACPCWLARRADWTPHHRDRRKHPSIIFASWMLCAGGARCCRAATPGPQRPAASTGGLPPPIPWASECRRCLRFVSTSAAILTTVNGCPDLRDPCTLMKKGLPAPAAVRSGHRVGVRPAHKGQGISVLQLALSDRSLAHLRLARVSQMEHVQSRTVWLRPQECRQLSEEPGRLRRLLGVCRGGAGRELGESSLQSPAALLSNAPLLCVLSSDQP